MAPAVTKKLHNVLIRIVSLRPLRDDRDRHLSLALYRGLAEGHAIRADDLSERLGWPVEEVDRRLATWPSQIRRRSDGAITGFGGLSVEPTPHRLLGGLASLYTWCAWDTLFIPAILATQLDVESRSPGVETPVRLTVGPSGALAEDRSLCLTFPAPTAEELQRDVIGSFCCHVFFFPSRDAAASWAADRDESLGVVDLQTAFELGRRKNRLQFGDVLPSVPARDPP